MTRARRLTTRAALWLHGWLTRRLFVLEHVPVGPTGLEYGDIVRLKVLPNSADAFVVLAVNTDAAALAACPVGYDANDIVHVWALRDVERIPGPDGLGPMPEGWQAFTPQPPE
jgi:hypothetical protein